MSAYGTPLINGGYTGAVLMHIPMGMGNNFSALDKLIVLWKAAGYSFCTVRVDATQGCMHCICHHGVLCKPAIMAADWDLSCCHACMAVEEPLLVHSKLHAG